MHSFEVHSNESACRKSDRLGLEQVIRGILTCINYQSVIHPLPDDPPIPFERFLVSIYSLMMKLIVSVFPVNYD